MGGKLADKEHRLKLAAMAAVAGGFHPLYSDSSERGSRPKPPDPVFEPFDIVQPPKSKRAKRRARGKATTE